VPTITASVWRGERRDVAIITLSLIGAMNFRCGWAPVQGKVDRRKHGSLSGIFRKGKIMGGENDDELRRTATPVLAAET
jgi:hypothetical protein